MQLWSCSAVLILPQCHNEPLFRNFEFCFLIDVWINSKIYLNVSELILKYRGSACNMNSYSLGPVHLGTIRFSSARLGWQCEWSLSL
jgi:hypothetical protein